MSPPLPHPCEGYEPVRRSQLEPEMCHVAPWRQEPRIPARLHHSRNDPAQRPVDRPVFEPLELGLLFTLPDHLWLRVMVNLAGTSNLDWALQTFFKEEEAQSLFAKVEQMANSRPAGAGGLLYHPYLSQVGLIAPVVARGVHAQFSGLRSGHRTGRE
jgi:hypothetical protein